MTERVFYLLMFFSFIYLIYRFRNALLLLLIILLFYDGFFASFGDQIWNMYKVVLPVLALACALKYRAFHDLKRGDTIIILTFILFSLSFFLSSYLNGDYFTLVFSQYSKYFNLLLMYLTFKKLVFNRLKFDRAKKLLFVLLIVQVIFTIL
jgi:hypothetical protein